MNEKTFYYYRGQWTSGRDDCPDAEQETDTGKRTGFRRKERTGHRKHSLL